MRIDIQELVRRIEIDAVKCQSRGHFEEFEDLMFVADTVKRYSVAMAKEEEE